MEIGTNQETTLNEKWQSHVSKRQPIALTENP